MSGHNQITLQPGDEPAVIDFPTLDRYDYIIESLKPMQLRFDGVTDDMINALWVNEQIELSPGRYKVSKYPTGKETRRVMIERIG